MSFFFGNIVIFTVIGTLYVIWGAYAVNEPECKKIMQCMHVIKVLLF